MLKRAGCKNIFKNRLIHHYNERRMKTRRMRRRPGARIINWRRRWGELSGNSSILRFAEWAACGQGKLTFHDRRAHRRPKMSSCPICKVLCPLCMVMWRRRFACGSHSFLVFPVLEAWSLPPPRNRILSIVLVIATHQLYLTTLVCARSHALHGCRCSSQVSPGRRPSVAVVSTSSCVASARLIRFAVRAVSARCPRLLHAPSVPSQCAVRAVSPRRPRRLSAPSLRAVRAISSRLCAVSPRCPRRLSAPSAPSLRAVSPRRLRAPSAPTLGAVSRRRLRAPSAPSPARPPRRLQRSFRAVSARPPHRLRAPSAPSPARLPRRLRVPSAPSPCAHRAVFAPSAPSVPSRPRVLRASAAPRRDVV